MVDKDSVFAGQVPEIYDKYLVPLIFEPYARDIASRLARLNPSRVLEVACGTGAVTRDIASALPGSAHITATDLNPPMLEWASRHDISRPVEWQPADAMNLPFEDASFDAVVCQFGIMFCSDKPKAFSEARRVLIPGGTFLFNTWDRIYDNEFADVITHALAGVFPDDPPNFMARTPHGYHDVSLIREHLRQAGFENPTIETISERSRAADARIPAIAYCHGTPWRDEIFARDPSRVDEATSASERAIAALFGSGPVDGKIQAHVITAQKS
jgi:ubiquinone/menaquinone biosynthesis C-methylase UbiE